MTAFLSTIESKIDSKGRVSVPAPFRAAATAQGFNGIYLFPSFTEAAIEGGGQLLMDNVSQMVAQLDPFTEARDSLATALFADSHRLHFDGDGRVSIPPVLLTHAGIDKALTFVGLGAKFMIWQPKGFATYRDTARKQARQHRGLLRSLSGIPATPPPEEFYEQSQKQSRKQPHKQQRDD